MVSVADMIVSLSCFTIFLFLPYSFLYKNIVYESIEKQNLLKLKSKLRIKLGSTFCKASSFMEKSIFKLVSIKKYMVIGS